MSLAPTLPALFAEPAGNRRQRRNQKAVKPARKTKVTLYVDDDLARRFTVHATYTDHDKSSLFAELIRAHCNRFIVSDRAKSDGELNRPADDAKANGSQPPEN